MVITETERLVIRCFSVDDAEGFFALNNDPVVMRYTGDKPFATMEKAKSFLKRYRQYAKYGFGRWSVYLKEPQRYIGFCGLKRDPVTGDVDLGFRLMREFWNKGYATESSRAVLALATERYQLQQVVARAMVENEASNNVLKKLGIFYRFFKQNSILHAGAQLIHSYRQSSRSTHG